MSHSPALSRGKCSNFGNCSVADSYQAIDVMAGTDTVCTECGKPLMMLSDAPSTGVSAAPRRMGMVVALVLLLGLALAGGWVWMGRTSPPAAVAPATPVAEPATPAVLTGHCSDADAQAGLCQKR